MALALAWVMVSSSPAPAASGHAASCPQPRVVAQINLHPPAGHGSRASGVAEIFRDNCYRETTLAIVAQHLRPNDAHNAYAVWLSNSRKSRLLGFVSPPVGKNGRLRTEGVLPAHYRRFRRLVISLERTARPERPHHIVLIGRFAG